MDGVSVVLCCYNSAKRLEKTLQHLAVQKATIPWEIVLVNNASTDNTIEVATKVWSSCNSSDTGFIIVNEDRPGLNYAREKGITTARYSVVIFCDDDNYLMAGYIQKAYTLLQEHPEVGLAGGIIYPIYETNPPDWFLRHAHYLAIGKQSSTVTEGDISADPGILFGAGLVIRKSSYKFLKQLGFKPILSDRKKETLLSGGDTEICFAFNLIGSHLYYSEELVLNHYIPTNRIEWEYLKRLHYFFGKSSIYYMAYWEHLSPNLVNAAKGFKKRWLWQWLSTTKELLKCLPQAGIAWIKGERGNDFILRYYFLRGRILEILILNTHLNLKYDQVNSLVNRISREKSMNQSNKSKEKLDGNI